MRLLRFGPEQGRAIDGHGSVGFRIAPLARIAGTAHVAVAHLGPGGRIGRHPSVARQLFAVVSGSGFVSGADRTEAEVRPGIAALWEPGEEHETRTDEGLVAVILEGLPLDAVAPE